MGTFLLLDRLWIFPLLLLLSANVTAQDRKVDPTWLRRSVAEVKEVQTDLSSPTCHYKPIFGTGDPDSRILRSVSRFAEVSIDAGGSCQTVVRDREEELDFVLEGAGKLSYAEDTHPLRARDFTYLPPGMKHGLANNSSKPLRVLIMDFKIPAKKVITPAPPQVRVINLDDLKEETVSGHPDSVLYKLMVGPRGATRDAIDDAYVVTSLFWMDFAPGGTNFPHHHETAEEIYLVIEGEGDMVAGGGMDGVEGRHPAKPGDAYYFRSNCTVGFYNQNKPGAKAYILAVRSLIPLSKEED
ncbi:MAG TPA: cupin domain-containing protein [Candidatus Sulfotelmatobacter sp.]